MLQRIADTEPPRSPIRPARVLIEDPQVASSLDPPPGFEVVACAGPSDGEVCPLVVHGRCPLGPCDVVVTALDGPWAHCVRAAWQETRVPVVDAGDVATSDPQERLAHHLGAAIQHLWPNDPPFR